VWNNDLNRVNELIGQKVNLEETELDMQPLNLAVIRDNLEIAKRLLDAGANVDGGSTLALAITIPPPLFCLLSTNL
jgi:hypothetical protein